MLPYNQSTSLDYSSDEWVETEDKKDEQENKEDSQVNKKKSRRTHIVIPSSYLEQDVPNVHELLHDMPVGIDLKGTVQQENGHLTVFNDERVQIDGRSGNSVLVTPKEIPESSLAYLALLLFNPGCKKVVAFPPVKTIKNKINKFELAKDGIIGIPSDIFANGGLDLLKIQTRQRIKFGFPLTCDFNSYVNETNTAQFVFCLIPMEDGEYVISKAVRSQPFFGGSKRRQKTLGKRGRSSAKEPEINKFNTEIQNITTEIDSLGEEIQTLSYKRNLLNDCNAYIQRVINQKRDKSSDMLCMALDLLTRTNNKVHIDNDAEEPWFNAADDAADADDDDDDADDEMVESLVSNLLNNDAEEPRLNAADDAVDDDDDDADDEMVDSLINNLLY
jgi:hypothetical protein